MDPISIAGIVLGAVGLALSIGIAVWQNSKAKKAESELHGFMHSLPSQVLDNMSRLLQIKQDENLELYDLMNSEKRLHSKYADLDGDGEDELMVQYPFGAHGAALQIFGFRDWEFKLIDELTIDTMAGFTVEDIDGDGRLEIITHEVSIEANLPYVMGFRDEVLYRLEGNRLVEVNRKKLYEPQELKQAQREFNKPQEE